MDPDPETIRMLTACMAHCFAPDQNDLSVVERASLSSRVCEPMPASGMTCSVSDPGYPDAYALPRQESVPSLDEEIAHGAA